MRRLSITDRLMNGRGSWKLRASPMCVRRCAARPSSAWPAKCTVPVSLCSVPHTQLTSVLLPEPLGPIRPRRSPGCTSRSMPSSATKPPKRLDRPLTCEQRAHAATGRSARADRTTASPPLFCRYQTAAAAMALAMAHHLTPGDMGSSQTCVSGEDDRRDERDGRQQRPPALQLQQAVSGCKQEGPDDQGRKAEPDDESARRLQVPAD